MSKQGCIRHTQLPFRLTWVCIALAILTGCDRADLEIIVFQDVTQGSGLSDYEGMTHGAAWGDFDGDGKPDLYVTNHLKGAMLFHNVGGGKFESVTDQVFDSKDLGGDKHGAAWADFDNDGDQDLVQLTGAVQGLGEEPKRLFVNEGGRLTERAAVLGVDNPSSRSRMPLWIDLDRDGKLDLFHGAEARFDELNPPFLFAQQEAGFKDQSSWLPLASRSAPFCVPTELNSDGVPELVCRLMGKGLPSQIFDTRKLPATSLDLLPKTAFEDIAAADFDNDGNIDLFLARKNPGGRISIGTDSEERLTAQVELGPSAVDQETGFRFQAKGSIHIAIGSAYATDLKPEDIRIGSEGTPPNALEFDVAAAKGIPGPMAGDRLSILIGSAESGGWQLTFSVPKTAFEQSSKPKSLTVRITATSPIHGVEGLADSVTAEIAPQRLFMNRTGSLVEESDKRGVNTKPIAATNVVSADFDNDMDEDLFILGSNDAGKTENQLLLNNGKGYFVPVKLAGGAAGVQSGVGDFVTTADVDGDGFLDILTGSGASMGRSLGMPSDNGRYELFQNKGNENHWLMIDLVGVTSNRDGTGALVQVTAGGVTQIRFQGGGMHERGQNHARLHFGLAKFDKIDVLKVKWVDGSETVMKEVGVNRILRVSQKPQ